MDKAPAADVAERVEDPAARAALAGPVGRWCEEAGGGMFGGAPGGGGAGGGGGGMFGGRGRLNRQAVNRIRFSFYDRYKNSVWDAQALFDHRNRVPEA